MYMCVYVYICVYNYVRVCVRVCACMRRHFRPTVVLLLTSGCVYLCVDVCIGDVWMCVHTLFCAWYSPPV
jgi:hypothetical protein